MRNLPNHIHLKSFGLALLMICFSVTISGQTYYQRLGGVVIDAESRSPLPGAYLQLETPSKIVIVSADSAGQFRMMAPPGRHTLKISFIGYNTLIIKNIQIGSGKEANIVVELTEAHHQTDEIEVVAKSGRSINPMAAVSVHTLRSQDASRYAGGYYDPLRMVANFPGVASGNSDDNNEIVIRGNSPRGLLWRLDGIEIPNPNHLSNGEGGSGGAFSVISTNSLTGFDFFTGAFPAEYGNAYSGVMDLNLRNGNSSKHEYSAGISVVGAEASAEGPLNKLSGNSWFGNFRYANFDFLTKYGIINKEEVGIVPSSMDWALKASFKTKKSGTFDFFSVGGSSRVGDVASTDLQLIKSGADKDEYLDTHFMAVAGVKHLWILPDSKSYLRTTAGFTIQRDASDNDQVDTLFRKTITYSEKYSYPAFRLSVLFNHKFSVYHSIRVGVNHNQLFGDLFAKRLLSANVYDTLLNTRAGGWYNSYFVQWKYKPVESVEIITGLHLFHTGITSEFVWEPRLGCVFYLPYNQTISIGSGLHSRLEPLSIYNYRVKTDKTHRSEINSNLKTIKALHFTVGYNKQFGTDWHVGFEAYYQSLFKVPVAVSNLSQYSILNSSYGLPDIILVNDGKGENIGIEFTVEKDFTFGYYFLFTASLFDSKYRAPDGKWYNTYFNNNYIYNLTGGKEFAVGRERQNTLGFNFKTMIRGGFRYTPVDQAASIKNKRVVYQISETYGERLPAFERVDLGLSYRLNKSGKAWIFMIDIQNVANRKNIVRNKFSYSSGKITESTSKSIGIVPIPTIKLEF
jgi:hypothetical protein